MSLGRLARTVLLVLACLAMGVLIGSWIEQFTRSIWQLKLVAGCGLDYHVAPVNATALACAHAEYIRLWPLAGGPAVGGADPREVGE